MNTPTQVTQSVPQHSPTAELIARVSVTVSQPIDIGEIGAGIRRIIPITGGELHGPVLFGKVLPCGADFQMVRPEGIAELDARYALELTDGTRIFVKNTAMRRTTPEVSAALMRGEKVDPALVYFRCTPQFEVQQGPWRWLMESMFYGTAIRRPSCVELLFYKLS